eukprot:CAMPEP_0115153348 /NCGR_PEP_ID=MMETSP0227-20121206/66677_1 /TAXON_ID=89957 /ORGANISM="Polarella glacialis, Strain CCMP 1383" /LENGTH=85 /DNA_ID=CAMNT_0002564079 /DNA_START=458 /DNA_END=712 /DNA_ORIENTATION=+
MSASKKVTNPNLTNIIGKADNIIGKADNIIIIINNDKNSNSNNSSNNDNNNNSNKVALARYGLTSLLRTAAPNSISPSGCFVFLF